MLSSGKRVRILSPFIEQSVTILHLDVLLFDAIETHSNKDWKMEYLKDGDG